MPSLDVLEQMSKLMIVNTDDSMDYPEAIQPNMIQVAGLQIETPKNLTKELKKFVESSKQGTVLMSLGTNIKSNELGSERLTEIIKTFAELPQYNFVWKFESDPKDLPIPLSKNVFIAKFLPQNDLLAHPKVKAFVTHSGALSTQESIWYGKPMIAIPFIVDQMRTSSKTVKLGVGVKLNFRNLNREIFKAAIMEVMTNSKYTENVQRISKDFRDKPMRPLDKAIWYIEHVMRHPNSPAYNPITLEVGYFIANSYDVMLVLFAAFFTLIFVALKTIKVARHFLGRSTSTSPTDKMKSN